MNNSVNTSTYGVMFAIMYALTLIIILVLSKLLGFRSNSSLMALVASVAFTANKFVKIQKREPSQNEKMELIKTSFLASILIDFIVLAVLISINNLKFFSFLFSMINNLETSHFIMIIPIVFIFNIFINISIIWFSYGIFSKVIYNSMLKKGLI